MHDPNEKLQNAAHEVADHVAEGATHAVESEAATGNELHNKAASATRSVKRVAGQVGHAMEEGYDRLSERASDSFRYGRDVAMRWEDRLEDTLQERPLVTVLVAATAGLLLGVLLMKNHHNHR